MINIFNFPTVTHTNYFFPLLIKVTVPVYRPYPVPVDRPYPVPHYVPHPVGIPSHHHQFNHHQFNHHHHHPQPWPQKWWKIQRQRNCITKKILVGIMSKISFFLLSQAMRLRSLQCHCLFFLFHIHRTVITMQWWQFFYFYEVQTWNFLIFQITLFLIVVNQFKILRRKNF